MSPADILAAARQNVVGPYLPAKAEWLEGHVGPFMLATDSVPYVAVSRIVRTDGRVGYVCASCTTPSVTIHAIAENIRLDARIPSVRDHLVRHGCPEWARDVPAAVWCWGMTGVAPTRLRCQWREVYRHYADPAVPISADATVWCRSEQAPNNGGHRLFADDAEGRACADVAALNAGCILREPGGWLVPMPDGGIGFFPETP